MKSLKMRSISTMLADRFTTTPCPKRQGVFQSSIKGLAGQSIFIRLEVRD